MRIVAADACTEDVTLYSRPISTYGLIVEIVLVEKGGAFEVVDVDPTSEEHQRRHPFGKIPVLDDRRSGMTLRICESLAIARYVDEAFAGPPLQPAAAPSRARMMQWIQMVTAYLVPTVTGGIIKPRLLSNDGPADETAIARAAVEAARQMDLVEAALASSGAWLAGEAWCLADAFLFPVLGGLALTPEGEALLSSRDHCRRWLEAMGGRESVKTTGLAARRGATVRRA